MVPLVGADALMHVMRPAIRSGKIATTRRCGTRSQGRPANYTGAPAPRDPGKARLAAKQCQSQAGARPDGDSSLLAYGQDGVFVEDDEILATHPHLCAGVLRVDHGIADLN